MDNTHELAYRTLGRVQAALDMLDQAELYRVTPERAIEIIRAAMADYKTEKENR